jgi:hypothetical protein
MLKKTDKKGLDEALTKISDVACLIECLATEYREKFDELSEKAQEGERGTKLDETASYLGELHGYLTDAETCGDTVANG